MQAREIKDLCIAMEALSRIPGEEAVKLSSRIRDIVTDLVYEEERRTTQHTYKPLPTPDLSDKIPF